MAEPRARQRNKGQVFNDADLRELLYAFGDVPSPLPSTATILDEILTDFIIETCHAAALCASYSRRQKIKVEDFRWVLRKNSAMLGRVNEQMFREKWLKAQRKAVDLNDFATTGGRVEELAGLAEMGGVDDELKKKGRRGRRKRKADDDEVDGKSVKRVAM